MVSIILRLVQSVLRFFGYARESTNKVETMSKLSKYFTLKEATYLPKWNTCHIPSTEELENIKKLALVMDKVREFLGTPCNVHVWIRPTALNNPESEHNGKNYNELVKGAKKSAHIEGIAVDCDFEGMTCDEARAKLEPKLEEFGLRMEKNSGSSWIHLDLREVNGGRRYFIP